MRFRHVLLPAIETGTLNRSAAILMEFPQFDGHNLTFEGECPDAENKKPVPCGIQGTDCCVGP